MSPRMTVAALLLTIACTDPDLMTSPEATGSLAPVGSASTCSADQGQQFIDGGEYKKAIQEFTCLINLDPTAVEGYRGRIEAQLMLGEFSNAVLDGVRVNAFVVPVHPDAMQTILAAYDARLATAPESIPALTGKGFAYWWFFNYPAAMHTIDQLLDVTPNDVFGNLFRGSSRVLHGTKRVAGAADLERAIELNPISPDVRFIVADAYTYGYLPDPQRALDEATNALNGGLNTPRVRAIRAASYTAFGNVPAAAAEIAIHFDLVTTELVATAPLTAGSTMNVAVAPGRVYDIPVTVAAGQAVSVATTSKDMWDTILLLVGPDGTPVLGSDDYKGYMAGFDWVAPADGTYHMRVSSFEAASTGVVVVTWK